MYKCIKPADNPSTNIVTYILVPKQLCPSIIVLSIIYNMQMSLFLLVYVPSDEGITYSITVQPYREYVQVNGFIDQSMVWKKASYRVV